MTENKTSSFFKPSIENNMTLKVQDTKGTHFWSFFASRGAKQARNVLWIIADLREENGRCLKTRDLS